MISGVKVAGGSSGRSSSYESVRPRVFTAWRQPREPFTAVNLRYLTSADLTKSISFHVVPPPSECWVLTGLASNHIKPQRQNTPAAEPRRVHVSGFSLSGDAGKQLWVIWFKLYFRRKVPLRLKTYFKRESCPRGRLRYEDQAASNSFFSIMKPVMFHFSATICFIRQAIIVDLGCCSLSTNSNKQGSWRSYGQGNSSKVFFWSNVGTLLQKHHVIKIIKELVHPK